MTKISTTDLGVELIYDRDLWKNDAYSIHEAKLSDAVKKINRAIRDIAKAGVAVISLDVDGRGVKLTFGKAVKHDSDARRVYFVPAQSPDSFYTEQIDRLILDTKDARDKIDEWKRLRREADKANGAVRSARDAIPALTLAACAKS